MAEGLFLSRLGTNVDQWRVESAGTWAMEGMPVAQKTQVILNERGIDFSNHRSRLVTGELINQFNLILTMEKYQKEALRIEFPSRAGQIYAMSDLVDAEYDIPDPIGGPQEEYHRTLREIEHILNLGWEKIVRLAEDDE
jgi:protein-tyrosine-phosphatase